MAKSYEVKKCVKKSLNPPWVDDKLLNMIKVRRAIFRQHRERSDVWKYLDGLCVDAELALG